MTCCTWLNKKYSQLCLCVAFFFMSSPMILNAQAVPSEPPSNIVPLESAIFTTLRPLSDLNEDGYTELLAGGVDGNLKLISVNPKETGEYLDFPKWPQFLDAPLTGGIKTIGKGHKTVIVATTSGESQYFFNRNGRNICNMQFQKTPGSEWQVYETGEGSVNMTIPGKDHIHVVSVSDGNVACFEPIKAKEPPIGDSILIPGGLLGYKTKNGRVYVTDMEGNPLKGWPKTTSSSNDSWGYNMGSADVAGDGGSVIYTTTASNQFIMWDLEGNELKKFNISSPAFPAPTFEDVDGNGITDVIIAQKSGEVMVCNLDGKPLKGWPYRGSGSILHQPKFIDIDGDGHKDLVFVTSRQGGQGRLVALDRNGKTLSGYPKDLGQTYSNPVFSDINNDGYMEIILASIKNEEPHIHVFPTKAKSRIRMVTLGHELVLE
ncbi:MAG: hypothetical protein GX221_06685 [Candidatus Riflebacteria bacterium]|nr:hypothetical protein [Candidatus Riflebacteria bacterium]